MWIQVKVTNHVHDEVPPSRKVAIALMAKHATSAEPANQDIGVLDPWVQNANLINYYVLRKE